VVFFHRVASVYSLCLYTAANASLSSAALPYKKYPCKSFAHFETDLLCGQLLLKTEEVDISMNNSQISKILERGHALVCCRFVLVRSVAI